MDEETCFECKKPTEIVFDHNTGDTICSECGLVIQEHNIEVTAEWRTFADDRSERDPNRIGDPTNPLLKSSGLVTVIEKPKENAASSVVSKDDINTLCRSQYNVKNQEEDLIKKGFEEIERMREALELDINVKFRACEIISKFDGNENKKLRKGKKFIALCAASVSIACRELNYSRTLKEISLVAYGVELKEIRKASLMIKRLLEPDQVESAPQMIINTGELVRRFCSKLDISQREMKAIREAVEKAENYDIRRNPKSVLAAIIFMITQISQTNKTPIREIGIVSEVVENTIKNSVKDMYPYAVKIIPNWYAREERITKMLGGIISSWDSSRITV